MQLGEFSGGRQALEGADLAPGSDATLRALTNPARRPNRPREPVPPIPAHRPFELDEGLFGKSLRSAKRGASGGPSGMTWEHLRPLLERPRDTHLLFRAGELLCQGQVAEEVVNIIRLGRLIALQKPTGGVRGIVAGEVQRRLVARTMAQQLGPAVENFRAPFQFALTTRSGCECVAHTIQTSCQADPELTLTSLDGVSAFDLISRRAMLEGHARVSGGAFALPFVHLFYGRPSRYLWEDDHGVVRAIEQGEGGEQGDPLMPLLFAVGQHAGLVVRQERMQGSERLFAFLG